MKKRLFLSNAASVAICIILSISALSCKKEKNKITTEDDKVKQFELAMMTRYYYWADNMKSIKANNYDVSSYFYGLLVQKDRWSWMTDGKSYREMETGESTSYGINIAQAVDYYNDYGVYVTYIDKESPAGKAGIKRGYKLTHIGNKSIETLIETNSYYAEFEKGTNTFTFITTEGESKEFNLTKSTFKYNSVIYSNIFTSKEFPQLSSDKKVGYINYTTFTKELENDILDLIYQMKQENVNELILDLRYNGGGDLKLCTKIASLLAPQQADGKVFVTLKHNNTTVAEDKNYIIERTENSLDLDRLYVITGEGTASASEDIINCLSPYIEVITVGEVTYGKPNGMYVFVYPQGGSKNLNDIQYAFFPICFYCMNSQNRADFDNGIKPTNLRYDDIYNDWGEDEDLINSCLTHIATGKFSDLPAVETTKSSQTLQKRIAKKSSSPHYGMATIEAELQ